MNGFNKVSLQEYQSTLTSESESRTVIVIAESKESAEQQLGKFAEHLKEAEGISFVLGEISEMQKTHITYTQLAWKQLNGES